MMNKLFSLVLISSLFIAPTTSAAFVKKAGTELFTSTQNTNQDTDRLFKEMAILKIPGSKLPVDIQLTDLNGGKIILSDFKGKIVFLNFWTTWCPPCRLEMPSMQKLHDKLKSKDFAMVGIDLQEPASRVKGFVEEFKLTFTILLDSNGDVGRLFGIRSIPTTFILDKDGSIIGQAIGPREWDSNISIALFEHLINQKTEKSSIENGTRLGHSKDRNLRFAQTDLSRLGNIIKNAKAKTHK